MTKYKVIRDTHGFQGRYWNQGDIVDLDEAEKPPRHFVPVSDLKQYEEDPEAYDKKKHGYDPKNRVETPKSPLLPNVAEENAQREELVKAEKGHKKSDVDEDSEEHKARGHHKK